MTEIVKCKIEHCELLAKIGVESFLDSHGKSASKEDVYSYVNKTFNEKTILHELENTDNIYHIIYHKNQIAGYSKIVFNVVNTNIKDQNVTKLERLYLLKEYYNQNIGAKLFNYNIQLSKENNQKGIWLAVWVENQRAIDFYTKNGFKIVGSYDFKISETHSNPNHIMYFKY